MFMPEATSSEYVFHGIQNMHITSHQKSKVHRITMYSANTAQSRDNVRKSVKVLSEQIQRKFV